MYTGKVRRQVGVSEHRSHSLFAWQGIPESYLSNWALEARPPQKYSHDRSSDSRVAFHLRLEYLLPISLLPLISTTIPTVRH